MSKLLDALEERRAAATTTIETLLADLEVEERESPSFTEEEQRQFDEASTELETVLAEIDTHKRAKCALKASAKAISEKRGFENQTEVAFKEVYEKGNRSGHSFFRDTLTARNGDFDAMKRLARNNSAVRSELEKRDTAGMSPVTGVGGEFTPPLWAVDQFVKFARPGRPTADAVTKQPLPRGVSSINLPTITSGSVTRLQSNPNTTINMTVPTTGVATGAVGTIAGGVPIAQQMLDQSPINFDDIIIQDLGADYGRAIDAATIAAIVAAAGNVVTYTDASPTSVKVTQYFQQAVDLVSQTRFAPPSHAIMRTDRWGRFLSTVDGNGRPLVLPNPQYGAMNAVGQANGQNAEGVAGTLRAVAALLDTQIPNNLGTGTNQDEIIVAKLDDVILYESAPVAEILPQTYGNQLSLLARYYVYYTVIANRYPKGIAVLTGTGMVPPAYGS